MQRRHQIARQSLFRLVIAPPDSSEPHSALRCSRAEFAQPFAPNEMSRTMQHRDMRTQYRSGMPVVLRRWSWFDKIRKQFYLRLWSSPSANAQAIIPLSEAALSVVRWIILKRRRRLPRPQPLSDLN